MGEKRCRHGIHNGNDGYGDLLGKSKRPSLKTPTNQEISKVHPAIMILRPKISFWILMMVLWAVNGIAQLKNEWTNVAIEVDSRCGANRVGSRCILGRSHFGQKQPDT